MTLYKTKIVNIRQQATKSMETGSAMEEIPKTVNEHTKRITVEREDIA